MHKVDLVACALGISLFGGSFTDDAFAAPLGPIGSVSERLDDASTTATLVGYRCSRCGTCYDSRPAWGYYAPRYEPSVVYYGPSGIYRPYPPIVVYEYPAYAPYYSPRRYTSDYYYRRW